MLEKNIKKIIRRSITQCLCIIGILTLISGCEERVLIKSMTFSVQNTTVEVLYEKSGAIVSKLKYRELIQSDMALYDVDEIGFRTAVYGGPDEFENIEELTYGGPYNDPMWKNNVKTVKSSVKVYQGLLVKDIGPDDRIIYFEAPLKQSQFKNSILPARGYILLSNESGSVKVTLLLATIKKAKESELQEMLYTLKSGLL